MPPPPPPRHQPPPAPPTPSPLKKPTDFIFTAFSLFLLFSSSSPKLPKRVFFTMSFPKPPTPPPFSSPKSLSDWLKPRLNSDSFASWGVKPGTKNVHNLFLELSQGETILDDSATPPLRKLEVVVVRVVNSEFDKVLIESHQELSDGAVRRRGRPLSEKMKPGETVEEAVFRAVKEELGCDDVKIVGGSYFRKVEERVSLSYPGLPASYVLHTVDATVEGLPEGEFWTEEGEEYGEGVANGAISCKKHYWKWVDSNTIG